MAKPVIPDAVDVLRFFETGPLPMAEVLFSIVSEKMRERSRGEADVNSAQTDSTRKRARKTAEESAVDPAPIE